jgi:hypothetical protein
MPQSSQYLHRFINAAKIKPKAKQIADRYRSDLSKNIGDSAIPWHVQFETRHLYDSAG